MLTTQTQANHFHTIRVALNSLYQRVLEKVNFERKFDQLPEFQPERIDQSSVPQSPSVLLAGLRKKYDGIESPAAPAHSGAVAAAATVPLMSVTC